MLKAIDIKAENVVLEGVLDLNSEKKGVVITHPHPLYGGNMENSVVHTLSSLYKSKGYTTLRFNFRGVGGSSGSFDDGGKEQTDVEAAMQYLQNLGITQIDLAGYSFGAWVIHRLLHQKPMQNRIVLVSPPIDFLQFEEDSNMQGLALVVVGSYDELAPVDKLQALVKAWNPATPLKIVEGADHFYSGHFSELAHTLATL